MFGGGARMRRGRAHDGSTGRRLAVRWQLMESDFDLTASRLACMVRDPKDQCRVR